MRTKVLAAPEPVLHTVMCAWQWCHRGGVRCASAAHSSCGILADERMPSPRSALREPNRRETLLSPWRQLVRIWPQFGSVGFLGVGGECILIFFFFFFAASAAELLTGVGAHRPGREHVQWERRKCCTKVSTGRLGKSLTRWKLDFCPGFFALWISWLKQRDNLPSPASGNANRPFQFPWCLQV